MLGDIKKLIGGRGAATPTPARLDCFDEGLEEYPGAATAHIDYPDAPLVDDDDEEEEGDEWGDDSGEDADAAWDSALAASSGNVRSPSALVNVLYHLMERHIPAGVMERLVREAVEDVTGAPDGGVRYENGWLASSAEYLARQLDMAEIYSEDE